MDSHQTNTGSPLGECKMLISFGDLDLNYEVTIRLIKSNLSRVLASVYTFAPECD